MCSKAISLLWSGHEARVEIVGSNQVLPLKLPSLLQPAFQATVYFDQLVHFPRHVVQLLLCLLELGIQLSRGFLHILVKIFIQSKNATWYKYFRELAPRRAAPAWRHN